MQHVSGTAVGQTDSNLKLRKPRSASHSISTTEKGKLVPATNNKAAPAKEKIATKTAQRAANTTKKEKGTIRKSDALRHKEAAPASPKKDTKKSAAPRKRVIEKATPQKAKEKESVVRKIEQHQVAPAAGDEHQFTADHSFDSGVAARVAEAKKNLPEPEKGEFRFAIVKRLKEFFKKVSDIFG